MLYGQKAGPGPAFYFADKYMTMNKPTVEQAVSALVDALKGEQPKTFLDNPKEFVKKIPFRSLSGDHLNGGKIQNFSSSGIQDHAGQTQLEVRDDGIVVNRFAQGFDVEGTVSAKKIKTEIIEVKELLCATTVLQNYVVSSPMIFNSDNLEGLGLLWQGKNYTKQLIFASNPDRFFVSENVDIGKGKSLSINSIKVLDENSLGPTITKSNLKQVGRLNGLIVDGTASIGGYFYFDSNSNRLGIGTEQPNAAVSVIENDVEIVIGAKETAKGFIGTFNSQDLYLGTDNTPRLTISSGGNITLGNPATGPIQVTVQGKLAVNVNNPDTRANIHTNGPIKFNNKLHMSGTSAPDGGVYNEGDIVWNSTPFAGQHVGWVCTRSGTPGIWNPFGRIE